MTEPETHIEELQSSFKDTSYEEDMSKYTKIDNLDEDKGEESYVLVSFASPEGIMNCTVRALKIRVYNNQSVFRTFEQANVAAKELNKVDKYFPIFVMPCGKWCAWDPSPDDKTKVADQKWADPAQQKLMDGLDAVEKKKLEQERQERESKEMNALVGKTKDKINVSSKDHKKRVANSITQGINEKDVSHKEAPQKEAPQKELKSNSHSHDSSKLKDKLRAKLEAKRKEESDKNPSELSSKVDALTEQVKETSQVSSKLDENINKAKELLQKMQQKKKNTE